MHKDQPVSASGQSEMVFLRTQGDLGYEVPTYFWEFLKEHGGLAISGQPISQLHEISDQRYQQCFTNLCLEYDAEAVESRRVHPIDLGRKYDDNVDPDGSELPTATPLEPTTVLQVWETQPTLDNRLLQEIGVIVWMDGWPLSDAEPLLTLTMPDGSAVDHVMPKTGMDGKSLVRLPLDQGTNMVVIPYKVCIKGLSGQTFCVADSFLTWGNP